MDHSALCSLAPCLLPVRLLSAHSAADCNRHPTQDSLGDALMAAGLMDSGSTATPARSRHRIRDPHSASYAGCRLIRPPALWRWHSRAECAHHLLSIKDQSPRRGSLVRNCRRGGVRSRSRCDWSSRGCVDRVPASCSLVSRRWWPLCCCCLASGAAAGALFLPFQVPFLLFLVRTCLFGV